MPLFPVVSPPAHLDTATRVVDEFLASYRFLPL